MPAAKDAYRKAMREDLLTAAQAVVARRGLAGLTIREVLAEAGVAPGTLYAYFEGKDELLGALARDIVGRVLGPAAEDEGASATALYWALLDSSYLRPTEGAELLADLRGRPSDATQAAMVRGINNELVAGMRPLLDRVRAEGHLGVDDVDALLELLDIVWDGLTRRASTGTFVTSYERVGALLLDLLDTASPRPPSS